MSFVLRSCCKKLGLGITNSVRVRSKSWERRIKWEEQKKRKKGWRSEKSMRNERSEEVQVSSVQSFESNNFPIIYQFLGALYQSCTQYPLYQSETIFLEVIICTHCTKCISIESNKYPSYQVCTLFYQSYSYPLYQIQIGVLNLCR